MKEIKALKEGYVKIHFNQDNQVEYSVTSKRPRNWVRLGQIPKEVYMAIVISEDWAFFEHKGVDVEQLQIAVLEALQGKKLRGASTITQQLAKNLFTNADRSIFRKVKELIIAKLLERELPKRKILEIYLNIIEYGRNLYGISDASHFYFDKNVSDLDVKEGAFLAMLLPSPVRYSQSFFNKELTIFANDVVTKILHKLVIAKVISAEKYDEIKEEPILFRNN